MSHDGQRFPAMGAHVLVHGATAGELEAIEALFADWDRVFSRFRPDSELNRVNRDPSPVVVLSRPFAFALRAALEAAEATGGLVDPTLGAAIQAAGYDRDFPLLADDARPPGAAAAKYLGLSESELRTKLESGKTLAQVAKDEGKSVDGLVAALKADLMQKLDQAVSTGRLTKAQEQQILAEADQRLNDLVNGKLPARLPDGRGPFGHRFGFGGSPGDMRPAGVDGPDL